MFNPRFSSPQECQEAYHIQFLKFEYFWFFHGLISFNFSKLMSVVSLGTHNWCLYGIEVTWLLETNFQESPRFWGFPDFKWKLLCSSKTWSKIHKSFSKFWISSRFRSWLCYISTISYFQNPEKKFSQRIKYHKLFSTFCKLCHKKVNI